MGRVHSEDVEDLDSARLGRERLDVVASDIEVLEESEGRGEAVGQGHSVDGQDWAVFFGKTLVLQAVDKAEDVGASGRSIDS